MTLRLESFDILNGKWISQKYIHVSPNPCNGSRLKAPAGGGCIQLG